MAVEVVHWTATQHTPLCTLLSIPTEAASLDSHSCVLVQFYIHFHGTGCIGSHDQFYTQNTAQCIIYILYQTVCASYCIIPAVTCHCIGMHVLSTCYRYTQHSTTHTHTHTHTHHPCVSPLPTLHNHMCTCDTIYYHWVPHTCRR